MAAIFGSSQPCPIKHMDKAEEFGFAVDGECYGSGAGSAIPKKTGKVIIEMNKNLLFFSVVSGRSSTPKVLFEKVRKFNITPDGGCAGFPQHKSPQHPHIFGDCGRQL